MYLYGASGHAKVIIDIITANDLKLDALYDDNENLVDLLGFPIIKPDNITTTTKLIISIGDNKIRRKIVDSITADYISLCHPSAIISPNSTIDVGSVVMQGAVIQSDAKVGKHSIINTSCSIDHECNIGNFVHISPNSTLCGNVSIKEGTWIGAGSVILPGVTIGKWCVIGAGSVVSKDIPDYSLASGNRCKILKQINIGL